MLRRPPHILVTTPESLYLLLTSQQEPRNCCARVETVIVDEIHALVRDKRGSHLALSLERLEALCQRPPVRIGLSATQRPIDEIARFLVGTAAGRRRRASPIARIIDGGHVRELDLAHRSAAERAVGRLLERAMGRNLRAADRADRRAPQHADFRQHAPAGRARRASADANCWATRPWPAITAACRERLRQSAEQRLKAGELKAIVATASLEMGIDIGYIDLVCQIGSPRSIATFLQRVGRAGPLAGQDAQGPAVSAHPRRAARIAGPGAGRPPRTAGPDRDSRAAARYSGAADRGQPWPARSGTKTRCLRPVPPGLALSQLDARRLRGRSCTCSAKASRRGSRRGAYLHRDRDPWPAARPRAGHGWPR